MTIASFNILCGMLENREKKLKLDFYAVVLSSNQYCNVVVKVYIVVL